MDPIGQDGKDDFDFLEAKEGFQLLHGGLDLAAINATDIYSTTIEA